MDEVSQQTHEHNKDHMLGKTIQNLAEHITQETACKSEDF